MTLTPRNPWNDARPVDPEQLPLGAFEGVPLVPAGGEAARGAPDADAPAAYRELPVCGEWSYEVHDDAESRGAALVAEVFGSATGARSSAVTGHPALAVHPANPVRSPLDAHPARAAGAIASARTAPPGEPLRPSRPPMTPRIVARVPATPTPLPALDELRSQHEAHPGDANTAIALATAFDKRGNIAAALGALQRAIDAGADAVPLRCARATILSGRLRYDDAEAELKKAAKVHADDPDVLLQQGILACRRAKWRDAVEPLSRLIKLDATSALALFYLGESLNKLDNLADALVAYEKATELEPTNWRALKGVGIVLDRMGRPADAAAFYRRARDAQSA